MKQTFSLHRKSLMSRLPDGLILLSGGKEIARNNDVNYVFRQNSNFLYLTGVEEAGCHLLLDPKKQTEVLFIPKIDNHYRVWEGNVPGPDEAKKLFGVSSVKYADELAPTLKQAAKGHKRLYADPAAWASAKPAVTSLSHHSEELDDALWELRAVKTEGELELLKKASEISGIAHRAVMASARPGQREFEAQAVFESECLRRGLKHLGYPSIVAAGRNAAVLHYRRNDALLEDGDFLLIDAGGELRGYGADITRTFPINGKFTRRQRDVYEIVLEAQKQCIERARPGITSAELHVHSMKVIAEGLRGLKILKGDVDSLVEGGAVRLFYPHGIGHLLGLDVHDGLGGKRRELKNPTNVPVRFVAKLEPGFVMTVEPGIYFIEALLNDKELRKRFKGAVDYEKALSFLPVGGVRIEDDVVIRAEGGPLNLTDVPKEVDDVEEACGR
jgi:Xaa-Pro dipeptidase